MREMSKTYAALVSGALCICAVWGNAYAQGIIAADGPTCATLLSNDSTVGTHIGPGDSTNRLRDTIARSRPDSASFGVGGARAGSADVMLLVGVHADEVKFAAQPHLRARLCWGGDTLRVVQRDNLPSPIVPGTTYRNVYIAVELIGRVNAQCLADRLGVGNNSARGAQTVPRTAVSSPTSATECAFLGGTAAGGAQNPGPPTP